MTKLRVLNFSMSVDGYAAGPDQSLEHPFGTGADGLREWVFRTRYGRQMIGQEGGDEGIDHERMVRGQTGIGATIMGRNMFSPTRGPWLDDPWRGWWGDEPPFHHPVFVLTNHARDALAVGETTFHFVTDGIESALEQATAAAGGEDIRLGGGPNVVRQYLRAGLVDELNLVIAPVLIGRGERLFEDMGGGPAGFEAVELLASASVVHVRFERKA